MDLHGDCVVLRVCRKSNSLNILLYLIIVCCKLWCEITTPQLQYNSRIAFYVHLYHHEHDTVPIIHGFDRI